MQRRTDRVTILGAARLGALNKCCVLCWWGRAVGPPAVKMRRSSLTGNPLTRAGKRKAAIILSHG